MRIGGRAEADIPQDELARVTLEPLDQAQLPDIQRLGLGHRADDRMKRLVMGEGMDAVRAIGELNDSVSGGGLHGRTFEHAVPEAKLKERVPPDLWRIKAVGRDLAPPVRNGVLSASLTLPRPLKPGRRPPHQAPHSPQNRLQRRSHRLFQAWNSLGAGLLVAQQSLPHPLSFPCA